MQVRVKDFRWLHFLGVPNLRCACHLTVFLKVSWAGPPRPEAPKISELHPGKCICRGAQTNYHNPVFFASSPTASLQDYNYCLYFFHRWLFPMVIVKLTRKEIISNGIPVRKVEKKKRLTHLCPARVSDISQSVCLVICRWWCVKRTLFNTAVNQNRFLFGSAFQKVLTSPRRTKTIHLILWKSWILLLWMWTYQVKLLYHVHGGTHPLGKGKSRPVGIAGLESAHRENFRACVTAHPTSMFMAC